MELATVKTPEGEIDVTRPSTYSILCLLAQAGSKGMLAGELARSFTSPVTVHKRNLLINVTLERVRQTAVVKTVRRSETKERGVVYNHAPQWRWFITEDGLEYVAAGPLSARIAARQAVVMREAERLQAARQHREGLLIQAAEDGYGASTPACLRAAKVSELRAHRLSLRDIGTLFGITGERVRQIERFGGPCFCAACRAPEGSLGALHYEWARETSVESVPLPSTLGDLYRDWAQQA